MSRRYWGVFAGAVSIIASAAGVHASWAQEHAGVYPAADVAAGGSIFTSQCAVCHGLDGAAVPSVDMRRGQFRTAVTDDDLKRVITRGVPNAGMPPFTFDEARLNAIVAYIRVGIGAGGQERQPVAAGDAAKGKAVFESAQGACLTCHRVDGRGGRSGPDLSDIAAARGAEALRASLVNPSTMMHPINRPVRATTSDGRTITGRRLNEDTYTLLLSTDDGELVSLDKSKLARFEIGKTSTMPAYGDRLAPGDLNDLVAYLLTLKDAHATGAPAASGQGLR